MNQISLMVKSVGMMLKMEAAQPDHPFTPHQRKWLEDKSEEITSLDIDIAKPLKFFKNFSKFKKCCTEYENKFKEWGGNIGNLEKQLQEVRNQEADAAKVIFQKQRKP